MDKKKHPLIRYGIPLLVAAVIKGIIYSVRVTPFNADEAIVALMARHINQGQIPAFFYGQSYMGSLDAMLVAAFFRVFGEQVWVIRLVQSLLYFGTVGTTMMLAERLFKSQRTTLYAGLLIALPTVNAALYSTVSLGGYGEMLLIGNLLLLGGFGIITHMQSDQLSGPKLLWGLTAWGIGAGFAFWVVGLTLVFTLPILAGIIWVLFKEDKQKKAHCLAMLLVGGLLGSSPWWGSGILAGNFSIITELAGAAIAGANEGSGLIQPLRRVLSLVVFGGSVITGIRPPWSIQWLMLPILPIALIFWMAVLIHSLQNLIKDRQRTYITVIGLIGFVLAAGFIFSPYGDDPSGRYFLPLIIPMSLFAADMIVSRAKDRNYIEYALVGFILFFNLGGIFQAMNQIPPGLTTQFDPVAQVDHSRMDDLIEFLEDNDISAGYSNYWVSYPLAFLTQERIIFVPRLPYHEDFRYTARDDRYPPYTELVKNASDIAYITTRNPGLNSYLEEQFNSKGISWRMETIGDYTVYYQLSVPLHVEEIGLGETTRP